MAAIKIARVEKLKRSVCVQIPRAGITSTVLLALSVQLGSQAFTSAAAAADFSNAKRVYVPASLIERRIDYSLMGQPGTPATNTRPATVTYTRPPQVSNPAPRNVRYVQVNGSGYVPPQSAAPAVPTNLPSALKATVLPSGNPGTAAGSLSPTLGQAASKAKEFTDKHRESINASASQLKARAQQLMQDGRIEEARKLLFSASAITPADRKMLAEFAAGSVEKAKEAVASGDFDAASRAARQALSADPGNLAASQLLDESLTKLGVNFNDAGQRLKLASSLYEQGRYDEAAVEYRTSLKIKPSAEAHVGLGNIAARSNQKATSKQEYREALQIDSSSSAAHRQLGIAQYNDGDLVAASANLSKALGLDPKDKLAGKTLVELWQRQLAKLPTANSHLGLARAYQLAGDLTSAQAEYKEVVRMDPNNPNLPAARQSFKLALSRQQADNAVQAAKTLEAHGDLRDAYRKVYEAVGWNPADAQIRLYQGQLLEKLGQVPQAREAYMHVMRIQPSNTQAAQRLKELAVDAVAPLAVTGAAGSLAIPTLATGASTLGSAPVSTDAHVAALSGFALQMRDHMLAEKDRMQKIEDAAHAMLKSGSSSGSSGISGLDQLLAGASAAAAPAAAALPAAAPAVAADATGATGAIAPLSGAANTAQSLVGLTNSIAEFLKGGGVSGASTAAAVAPASAAAAPTAAAVTAQAATAAPAAAPDVLSTMPKIKSAYQRLMALEEQNKTLKDQLTKLKGNLPKKAAPAVDSLTAAAPPPLPTNTAATADAIAATAVPLAAPAVVPAPASSQPAVTPAAIAMAPSALPAASAFASPDTSSAFNSALPELSAPPAMSIASSPNMMAPATPSVGIAAAPPVAPDFRNLPPTALIESAPPAMTGGTAVSPSQVRFELTGIETGFTGVRLAVVLKNNGEVALTVPQEMRAVIRYRDNREATVKVVFSGTAVGPHSQMAGSIKVPLDKVDPTADLVLPNLLPPAGGGDNEVHLTMQAGQRAL